MNKIAKFWNQDESRKGQRRVPDGVRVYAVGDIHGHDRLLVAMLRSIEADIAASPEARNIVVFLGDLIDRGPDSAQVVDRLSRLGSDRYRSVFIAGNHEEVLLRVLDGEPSLLRDWLRFGGLQCAESYGIAAPELKAMSEENAVQRIRSAIPEDHLQFLRGFADSFSVGDYLFVHAGIRPGVPIEQQSLTDLRWIRSPFLESRDRHPQVVVHGHSISRDVEFRSGRIGIDTGAYRSGVLSAIVLDGADQRVLQVRQPT